jgi:hypothetical protein
MKNFLLVFLLLLGTKVNSQTSDDARVINISVLISGNVIGISYDKNYTLHNQVIFNVTNSFNNFIRNGIWGANNTRYLDVCYIAKNPGTAIMGTHNFWGVHDLSGAIVPATNNQVTTGCELRRIPSGGNCSMSSNISIVFAPNYGYSRECDDIMKACSTILGDCHHDCTMTTDGLANTTVREKFMTGYGKILTENWTGASNDFEPVSDIWQSDLPSNMSDECRTFIQASMSFIEGQGERRSENTRSNYIELFSLQPNPATSSVMLNLPDKDCQIRIMDAYGKLIYNHSEHNPSLRLSTLSWPSGAYFVTVFDTETGEKAQKVLIIQR